MHNPHLDSDDPNLQLQSTSSNLLHLSLDELAIGKFVGAGSFCVVHAADVTTPNLANTPKENGFVVKTVRHNMDQDDQQVAREVLRNELNILSTLSDPNIVGLRGVCEVDGDIQHLVLDRLLDDTLSSRLNKWRREVRHLTSKASSQQSLISRLRGVALGMLLLVVLEQLHKKGIVHRDLKPQNIGFDQGGNPVLFDFGLARRIEQSQGNSSARETRTINGVPNRQTLHSSLETFSSLLINSDVGPMPSVPASVSSPICDDDQQKFHEAFTQSLSFTESSGPAGSPRYMAPEIAKKRTIQCFG